MKLSLKPYALKRYKDIFLLFARHSDPQMLRDGAFDSILQPEDLAEKPTKSQPNELTDALERMGPTYVKIGQLLSSRADLLPPAYLKSLSRLHDKVKPFSFGEVEQIVQDELKVRISKAFTSFDAEPLAAASLGQVHHATLRDGRAVVVKIQRPGIREEIARDFEVLAEIAAVLDKHTSMGRRYRFSKTLEEFQTTLANELDYLREASNLTILSENLKEFPHIQVPLPVHDYTTHRVLTMDYIRGTKITKLSPLARLDINGAELADELFRAYLKQVLADGIFHADPHPGNIFLADDGRIALLDLGMVGRVTPEMQDHLLRLLLAVTDGESERALDIVVHISETSDKFDEAELGRKLARVIAEQKDATLERLEIGKTLLRVGKIGGETGLYAPPELTMLGKTLLQLDQVGRVLHSEFDPNASVRRNVTELLSRRMRQEFSKERLLGSALQLKDFVSRLPSQLIRILDAFANSELEVKVRTPDANRLLDGFQKIANRITTGLILSALIVGAALLMHVNTQFMILGYPGFAMVCFLIAGGVGLWLVINILLADHRDKRKRRH